MNWKRQEDPDGTWRGWVNQQLAGDYKAWFDMIDFLLMLKVPDMSAVQRWRTEQEVGIKKWQKVAPTAVWITLASDVSFNIMND